MIVQSSNKCSLVKKLRFRSLVLAAMLKTVQECQQNITEIEQEIAKKEPTAEKRKQGAWKKIKSTLKCCNRKKKEKTF
jgi:DNA-binding protein YbaB